MKRRRIAGRSNKSDSGQFLLDIRYQQNCSWQGSLQRLDTGKKINFRSALELLTLIQSAVGQQQDEMMEDQQFRDWDQSKEVDEKKGKHVAVRA